MEVKRVGLNHVHRAAAVIDRIPIVELNCTEIGEKQDIGGVLANSEGLRFLWVFQGGPLGADSHTNAGMLSCLGQPAVDCASLVSAASH